VKALATEQALIGLLAERKLCAGIAREHGDGYFGGRIAKEIDEGGHL
jgi:hypothetical protein